MAEGGLPKRLSFPLLLVFACLAAAVYGAINDQISYTVSPDYYHAFKFRQFAIPETMPPRFGAALVGVLASWWMGLVIGLPVLGTGLILLRDRRAYLRSGLRAILVVLAATFAAALAGLLVETLFPSPPDRWWRPEGVDAVAFNRAGAMHNAAYLGGLIGLPIALILMWQARGQPSG
ncbi:hypothetical protein [Jannaschia marina]|uniref:hypothetical protein n=1 Tax=Jannaschia marina TaxID=2741674 RepID=UPI0015C90FAD|nr:hypothetical protein [Jannaschia marina]